MFPELGNETVVISITFCVGLSIGRVVGDKTINNEPRDKIRENTRFRRYYVDNSIHIDPIQRPSRRGLHAEGIRFGG